MHTATAVVAAMTPAADIFTTGTTLADKAKAMLLAAGAAAIVFFLIKQLLKTGTFLAALIAIGGCVVLLWLLGNVNNPSLKKPFSDTVNNLGITQMHTSTHDPTGTAWTIRPEKS